MEIANINNKNNHLLLGIKELMLFFNKIRSFKPR
ncbi:hypothetical protein EZS27_015875 [termite gut metagenome]|uniref:Uncharacterized protein n=1 Tax=termite gut metagenome TaxID=433724 RepID=A0A5J4RSF5_9ZZZZ